jgi:hypothetical protein
MSKLKINRSVLPNCYFKICDEKQKIKYIYYPILNVSDVAFFPDRDTLFADSKNRMHISWSQQEVKTFYGGGASPVAHNADTPSIEIIRNLSKKKIKKLKDLYYPNDEELYQGILEAVKGRVRVLRNVHPEIMQFAGEPDYLLEFMKLHETERKYLYRRGDLTPKVRSWINSIQCPVVQTLLSRDINFEALKAVDKLISEAKKQESTAFLKTCEPNS